MMGVMALPRFIDGALTRAAAVGAVDGCRRSTVTGKPLPTVKVRMVLCYTWEKFPHNKKRIVTSGLSLKTASAYLVR